MKKKVYICFAIIGIVIVLVGYRYIKYHDFFGRFYSDKGSYYQFNFFSWKLSYDGSDKIKFSLWNSNIERGNIYYTKEGWLYTRYDSTGVCNDKYKLEKKDNKIYLHFYRDNGELMETYVKEEK